MSDDVDAGRAALRDAGLADDDTTPFVTELLRRSVAVLVAEDEAKARADAEGSVLVRPGSGTIRSAP